MMTATNVSSSRIREGCGCSPAGSIGGYSGIALGGSWIRICSGRHIPPGRNRRRGNCRFRDGWEARVDSLSSGFNRSWSIAALAGSQIRLFIHRHHLGIFLAVGSDWPVWFGLDPKVSLTMSLDTEQIHRLTSKGFDKLYSSDPN